MNRNFKTKQTFVTSGVKLNDFKTQDSARVQLKGCKQLYCYIWKSVLLAGRKDEIDKKKGLKLKVEKVMIHKLINK